MTQLATIEPYLESKALWNEITAQYGRATGGMREVLKFGAMMMVLEAHLENVSKLDTLNPQRGRTSQGKGLKGLLDEHAPDINRSTAYRFRDVAKAVQKAYELPERATKRLTFEQLVTTEEELNPVEQKARNCVFEFVDGTSQKSLLDNFREPKDKGGKRDAARNSKNGKETEDEAHDRILETWTLLINELAGRAHGDQVFTVEWDQLTTRELRDLDERIFRVHETFRDALKARQRKP